MKRDHCIMCGNRFGVHAGGQSLYFCSTECSRQASLSVDVDIEPAMTFEEIGAELGITHARAKQLFNRAFRKLRAELTSL